MANAHDGQGGKMVGGMRDRNKLKPGTDAAARVRARIHKKYKRNAVRFLRVTRTTAAPRGPRVHPRRRERRTRRTFPFSNIVTVTITHCPHLVLGSRAAAAVVVLSVVVVVISGKRFRRRGPACTARVRGDDDGITGINEEPAGASSRAQGVGYGFCGRLVSFRRGRRRHD